ncbi:hypothetical protein BDQ12DRAFT_615298, partial [Crucibulum laeve]
ICFNKNSETVVSCIDAYGTTASSYPSSTTGFVPSATPILIDDQKVTYNPPGAWSNSTSVPSCSSEKFLRVTNVTNATISFSYTGPSVMIQTVTSPNGGVFSLLFDGFNTTDVIDTYSGSKFTLPTCFPAQFPPFNIPPPNFGTQNNHTVTLIYSGRSPNAPGHNANSSIVQFASFAIPDFSLALPSSAISYKNKRTGFILVVFMISVMLNGYSSGLLNFLNY